MLTTGPNLGLLDNGNYGEGTYHELLRLFRGLDTLVQPHVKSATTLTPPTSPAEGDTYVVPASATGLWAGQTGMIARWTARNSAGTPPGTPLWEFFAPKKGWLVALDDDAGKHIKFNGTTWYDFTNDATAITQSLTDEAAASAASASTSASTALAQATTATNAANVATDQADVAMTQAGIATTQAGIATTQAGIASAQQSIATTKAADAASSATASATSAATASTKAGDANASAIVASTQATVATTQAGIATTQANTATTQAGIATTKANEAASSAAALASSLESFRSQSLGDFTSDPTVDGNGDPLQEGAEYFNTVTDKTRIYVNGAWQDYDYSAQQLTVSAGLSATNAAASAGTAATQAGIASTQAGLAADHAAAASTSAGTASAQASTATTQAGIATTQAGIATTKAGEASASATSASGSAATATTQAGIATAQATTATTQAGIATTQATTATTQAGTATSQASSAAGSATAAAASATTATNQAAAAAASALSAASVVSQDLSAIDRTVFAATIVDTFLYDTEKDSDGGAWRKRCAHTSWENETLSGNWLGSAASEAAARAISGATTGSYYYDTTALGFYTLNAGSGKTATYRGNVRQFPAKVLITVEAARVVIWDLTQAGVPMWRVFGTPNGGAGMWGGGNAVAVAALNGVLCIAGSQRLLKIPFLTDAPIQHHSSASVCAKFLGGIAAWATSTAYFVDASVGTVVANDDNDVAMTVLPNAQVDVATGLPVPTIAVATGGNATYSTSVIKDDGTVVNVASDSTGTAVGVEFDGLALKVIRSDGNVYYWNDVRALTTGASPSATVSASTTPAALGTASKQAKRALSSSTGLTLMRRNQLTLASSMLAYITKDYNSGWMVGAIKGAWLADTTAEVVSVLFESDGSSTAGWTPGAQTTLSTTGTQVKATASGADAAFCGFGVSVEIGKTYTFTADVDTDGTSVPARAYLGTTVGYGDIYIDTVNGYIFGTRSFDYAATFTGTVYFWLYGITGGAGAYILVDSASARPQEEDRSVKAKGLQVFGSVTKSAVASGAALMGYSGFSAANYLEQPYNSDLDFGTGDFHFMGWIKESANTALERIISRGSYSGGYSGAAIHLLVHTSGAIDVYITDDAFVSYDRIYSTAAIDDGVWRLVVLLRRGGSLELWLNDAKASADVPLTNAAGSLSNASAVTRIGLLNDGTEPLTNGTLALWRAGAGAPSAEQIAKIYRDELPLFQANAACTLAGSSNAVTALAYDDETDLLHVGTSYGRSTFKGLVRVSSEATPVGAITALSASAGVIVQGGASGVDVYVPAYTLREELLRDAEQMAKFGQNLIAHDFTATASQTTFTLPVGWEIVAVYQQGAIKRETTSWTRSFDGFKWSAVLGTGATVSDWISILAKRVWR